MNRPEPKIKIILFRFLSLLVSCLFFFFYFGFVCFFPFCLLIFIHFLNSFCYLGVYFVVFVVITLFMIKAKTSFLSDDSLINTQIQANSDFIFFIFLVFFLVWFGFLVCFPLSVFLIIFFNHYFLYVLCRYYVIFAVFFKSLPFGVNDEKSGFLRTSGSFGIYQKTATRTK